MTVIETIVQQHAEEAAFLWLLRDAAVGDPDYTLDDLAKLDGRVEAHLDGLRLAGPAGWSICRDELSWEEAGEVFAAAMLALEDGGDERIRVVLDAALASPEQGRGFVSALGWTPVDRVQALIARLLGEASPAARRLGLAGSAVHRRDPGAILARALDDPDPPLRARALQAAGELGRTDLQRAVAAHLNEDDPACRFEAARTAALLGYPQAGRALCALGEGDAPFAEPAAALAARTLRPGEALGWIRERADTAGGRRTAIVAAGALGDPALAPWLIEQMRVPALARPAGEAFALVTGVDFVDEALDGEPPDDFEAGPTDDPDDENVAMDADEDLPWPDSERVRAWWGAHEARFAPGTRYLLGRPLDAEAARTALREGWQRQRAAAAQELALRRPGTPLFEVRAPGFRQRRLLAS